MTAQGQPESFEIKEPGHPPTGNTIAQRKWIVTTIVIFIVILVSIGVGVTVTMFMQRASSPVCFTDNKGWFSYEGILYYVHKHKVNQSDF